MIRSCLVLVALLALAAPVSAQGVDPNDPCYKTLTEGPLWDSALWAKDQQTLGSLLPRVNTVWGDAGRLNQYIGTLAGVLDRLPNLAMASDDPGYFGQGWSPLALQRVYGCLPWLNQLLARMESRLQQLGGVSGTVAGRDPRFEQMRRRVQLFALLLEQMLKRPGR